MKCPKTGAVNIARETGESMNDRQALERVVEILAQVAGDRNAAANDLENNAVLLCAWDDGSGRIEFRDWYTDAVRSREFDDLDGLIELLQEEGAELKL